MTLAGHPCNLVKTAQQAGREHGRTRFKKFGFLRHIAALMGHVDIAKILLEFRDCNVNAVDSHGRTPLGVVLQNGDTRTAERAQIAELLREHRAIEATSYTKMGPTGPA